MRHAAIVVLGSGLVFTAACGTERADESMAETTMTDARLNQVATAAWQALASHRIFFGHQSVGRNIVAGMHRVLAAHPEISLRIVGTDNPADVRGAAFMEANIGQNTRPATKTDAFANIVAAGLVSGAPAMAMYKFCYVDITSDTDPERLFEDYVRAMDEVQQQNPGLTIVHFTLPLTTAPSGIREQMATAMGRPTATRLNVKRNRYNTLMRQRYGDGGRLFDLARIESTRADGTRAFSRYLGRRVFMLADEWTEDGGHLNEEAQDRSARHLLVFLAEVALAEASSAAAPTVASALQRAAS